MDTQGQPSGVVEIRNRTGKERGETQGGEDCHQPQQWVRDEVPEDNRSEQEGKVEKEVSLGPDKPDSNGPHQGAPYQTSPVHQRDHPCLVFGEAKLVEGIPMEVLPKENLEPWDKQREGDEGDRKQAHNGFRDSRAFARGVINLLQGLVLLICEGHFLWPTSEEGVESDAEETNPNQEAGQRRHDELIINSSGIGGRSTKVIQAFLTSNGGILSGPQESSDDIHPFGTSVHLQNE